MVKFPIINLKIIVGICAVGIGLSSCGKDAVGPDTSNPNSKTIPFTFKKSVPTNVLKIDANLYLLQAKENSDVKWVLRAINVSTDTLSGISVKSFKLTSSTQDFSPRGSWELTGTPCILNSTQTSSINCLAPGDTGYFVGLPEASSVGYFSSIIGARADSLYFSKNVAKPLNECKVISLATGDSSTLFNEKIIKIRNIGQRTATLKASTSTLIQFDSQNRPAWWESLHINGSATLSAGQEGTMISTLSIYEGTITSFKGLIDYSL